MSKLSVIQWTLQAIAMSWIIAELISSVTQTQALPSVRMLDLINGTSSYLSPSQIKKINNTSIEYFQDLAFTYLLPPAWNATLNATSNSSSFIDVEGMLFFADSGRSFEDYAKAHSALQRTLYKRHESRRKLLVAYPRHSISSYTGMSAVTNLRVDTLRVSTLRKNFNMTQLWVSGHGVGGTNLVESRWYKRVSDGAASDIGGVILLGSVPSDPTLLVKNNSLPILAITGECDSGAPISRSAKLFQTAYLNKTGSLLANFSQTLATKTFLTLPGYNSSSFSGSEAEYSGLAAIQASFMDRQNGVLSRKTFDGFEQLTVQSKHLINPYLQSAAVSPWNTCPLAQKLVLFGELDSLPLKTKATYNLEGKHNVSFFTVKKRVRDTPALESNLNRSLVTLVASSDISYGSDKSTGSLAPVQFSCNMVAHNSLKAFLGNPDSLPTLANKTFSCDKLQAKMVEYSYALLTAAQKERLGFKPFNQHLNITTLEKETSKTSVKVDREAMVLQIHVTQVFREGKSMFGLKSDTSRDTVMCGFVPPSRLVETLIAV